MHPKARILRVGYGEIPQNPYPKDSSWLRLGGERHGEEDAEGEDRRQGSAWPNAPRIQHDHAATAVCWLNTAAIFRQPSIFRNLVCPLATRLKSRTSAASSRGGEIPHGA